MTDEENRQLRALKLLKVVLIDMDEVDTTGLPFKCTKASTNTWMDVVASVDPDVLVTWKNFDRSILYTMYRVMARRWIDVETVDEIFPRVKSCWENLEGVDLYDDVVSVFTPVHGVGTVIQDTYASLRAQSFRNWEWVITIDLKDGHTEQLVEDLARHDPRIRIFYVPATGKVGAVKDIATRLCRGAYLLELDHDDILLPTALEELAKAFRDDPLLGFVYSDCSEARIDGTCVVYQGPTWEGRYRDESFNGRTYKVVDQIDIYDKWGEHPVDHAAWYLTVAPNHLRAFRTSELRRLGGYNINMRVADDWDVMIRMYMRSSCYHIPKFLYIQRHGFGNTQSRSSWNEMIQYELQLARNRYAAEFIKFLNDKKWRPAQPGKDGENKRLTIAIPTWNRHENLLQLLEELDYPEIAIKVISDGHDPALQERVLNLVEDTGRDIQYLFTPATAKPSWGDRQRRFACSNCDTRYLWFVDDDNVVYENAIDAVLDRLEASDPDALFVAIDYDVTLVDSGSKLERLAPATPEDLQICLADTMNVLFRPQLFQWEETGYQADWGFINSIKSSSAKMEFAPEILAGRWRREPRAMGSKIAQEK